MNDNTNNNIENTNIKETFVNCKQNDEKNLFFFKKTNISEHLNKINTSNERPYDFKPSNLISYSVSDYNNYDLIYQMGVKTSNRVLDGEKNKYGIVSSNKKILSKSFNKENEELTDKFNYKNLYKNNCINEKDNNNNNNENENENEINLLGRYKNKKLHLNWNISKKIVIKKIYLYFKEKQKNFFKRIEVPNLQKYFYFNIGKIEIYSTDDYLKYNLFFKDDKEYNVFIEVVSSKGDTKSNMF